MPTDRASPTQPDGPNVVVVLPPVLYALGLALGFLLRWLAPWQISLSSSPRYLAGTALLVLGVALVSWGRAAMTRAGTNVDPRFPVTALVTTAPFNFSRNPLYVALNFIYLGMALLASSVWHLVLLVFLLPVMHFGVIRREERYLEVKFGDAYRGYRSHVRRYL